jgi:hypothetical protein
VKTPSGKLADFSKLQNLMGKTLCKGEHKESEKCSTIVLASDAPKSTLIHEYLHLQQISKGGEWCAISKKLWEPNVQVSPEIQKTMLDREWDVHRWLWKNKDHLGLVTEDKVGIAANLMDQAGMRSKFDPEAPKYLESEKVPQYLNAAIELYKKESTK